jgi:PII-like signaling protein
VSDTAVRATRLMAFLTEGDRYEHHALFEVLLERARAEGIAGATAWRGIEGYGRSGRLRTKRFVDEGSELPVVIEIIDRPERVASFLASVDDLLGDVLLTTEMTSMTVRS